MDCIVRGITKSQTQLNDLHFTSPVTPRGRKRDAFLHRINHSGLYLLVHCPHKRPAVSTGQGPYLSTKWNSLSRVCQWFHAPGILHALSVILTDNPARETLLPWLSRRGHRGLQSWNVSPEVMVSKLQGPIILEFSLSHSPTPSPLFSASLGSSTNLTHSRYWPLVCRRSEWVSKQNKFENFDYLICIFQAEYTSVAARKKTDCWLNSLLDFWTQWKQSLNNFVTFGLFLAQQKHFNWSLFLSQRFFLKRWGTNVPRASTMGTHTTVNTLTLPNNPANGHHDQVPEEETKVQSGYETYLGTHSRVKTGEWKAKIIWVHTLPPNTFWLQSTLLFSHSNPQAGLFFQTHHLSNKTSKYELLKWQPTPVFLPGESHGQRSLADYSSWGCKSRTWLSN